jgi:catechol 2,3-dioxygenase-like lactoylglutathione lyase family enzyme
MRFHHVCLVVRDTERAIAFWCDTMGFTLTGDFYLPDGDSPGPGTIIDPQLCDDIFGEPRSRMRCTLFTSPGGAMIELENPEAWEAEQTPSEKLRYRNTGMHELAFEVQGIDSWFDKIRAQGFKTTTDYVWNGGTGRTFLFADPEGNLIQLWETPDGAPKWVVKE